MKRLALLLPLLALAGCRQNGASIQVQAICAPSSDCVFSSTCGTIALGNPRIDRAAASSLILIMQLENQLPDNADANVGRLNTNDAHVDEATVEYSGALTGKVTIPATGRIPANGNQLVVVDAIPAAVAARLAPGPAYPLFNVVLAKIRIAGYYDDGSRFETAEFPVDIEVTTGGVATCAGACPQPGQWPATCP